MWGSSGLCCIKANQCSDLIEAFDVNQKHHDGGFSAGQDTRGLSPIYKCIDLSEENLESPALFGTSKLGVGAVLLNQ